MFDLDHAITDWRRQMAAGGISSPEVLDELESHLREDIEQQVRRGTEMQKAFESAVQRLGKPQILRDEFNKSIGMPGRRRKRFVQGFCFASAFFVLVIETWTLVEFDLGAVERVAGLCLVAVVAGYLASLPFLGRWLSPAAYTRFVGGVKIASLFVPLLPIWALLTAWNVIRVDIGVVPNFVIWLTFTAAAISSCFCGLSGGCGWNDGLGGTMFGISIPPPDRFDPTARQSLAIAREEASRLGHDFIGTEHVLLGALKLAEGAVVTALQNSNVDREAVRREVERLVVAQSRRASAAALPLTPRARKALRFAGNQARTDHQPLIRVEHILLGLLLEGSGVAALALKNLGIRIERLRG
jgi:hypothetical protein